MIRRLFSRGDDPKDHDAPRYKKAEKAKKDAEKDHQEAMRLIRLLEAERDKNHYAELVESALASTRHQNQNGDTS